MGTNKRIVLDANILVRAVLGKKVKPLLEEHYESVQFFAPEVCYQDARKYLPQLFKKKNLETDDAIDALSKLMLLVNTVESSAYGAYEIEAKQRIEIRDVDDWPVVAVALILNCPVWTEDADFFGTGKCNLDKRSRSSISSIKERQFSLRDYINTQTTDRGRTYFQQ